MISWPSYKDWINEVDVRIGTAIRLWHDVEEVKGSCQDSAASCVNAHGFCLHEICQDCVFKPFYFRPEKQFSSSAGKKKLRGNPRLEQMTTQKAFDCILPGLEDSQSSKHRFTSIQSNDSRHSYASMPGVLQVPKRPRAGTGPWRWCQVTVQRPWPEASHCCTKNAMTGRIWEVGTKHFLLFTLDWSGGPRDFAYGPRLISVSHNSFGSVSCVGVQYFGWSEISHIAVLTSAHWRNLDPNSKKSYQIHQFVLICSIYSNIVLEHLENLHTPLEDIREYKNGGIELRTVVIPSSLESWTPCHRSTSNLVKKKNRIEYEYDV